MIAFLSTQLGKLVGGLVAGLLGLLAVFGYGYSKKKEGASEAAQKAAEETLKKQEKARDAAYDEKKATAGLNDDDIIDRLQSRTDEWRRM